MLTRIGKLVVLEGPDCVGKTSIAKFIEQTLNGMGKQVLLVREPGGTEFGEAVRVLLKSGNVPMNKYTQMLTFMAARSQVYSDVIVPALLQGTTVICDRGLASTVVYQGYMQHIHEEMMLEINYKVTQYTSPDLQLILIAKPSTLLERGRGDNGDRIIGAVDGNLGATNTVDRFDPIDLVAMEELVGLYQHYYDAHKIDQTIRLIDANPSFDKVSEKVLQELLALYPKDEISAN